MVCLQELQPGNINVQVHLLTNIGIARTEGLDLRVGQRLLVNIPAERTGLLLVMICPMNFCLFSTG